MPPEKHLTDQRSWLVFFVRLGESQVVVLVDISVILGLYGEGDPCVQR